MQSYFHYAILAKLFGTEASLGLICRHDFTPPPCPLHYNSNEQRWINKCKSSTFYREGGRDYVNERLAAKMWMLFKQSKMGKIFQKSQVSPNVLFTRIIAAHEAVNLVLGHFLNTHNYCKHMRINYNVDNTWNWDCSVIGIHTIDRNRQKCILCRNKILSILLSLNHNKNNQNNQKSTPSILKPTLFMLLTCIFL